MTLSYDGGSFAMGMICTAVYFGALSPWWLLLLPLCLIGPPLTIGIWKSAR